MIRIFVCLLVVSSFEFCLCSRVLVVFPVPWRSHAVLGNSVVKTLVETGHEVTYVTPFPREMAAERLTYVDVSDALRGYDQVQLPELLKSPASQYECMQQGPDFARRMLQHDAVQALLIGEKFDVVIAEWYFSGLLAPAPELSWHQLRLMHEPSSPAYSADLTSHHVSLRPYSFWQRVQQMWLQVYLSAWGYYITNSVELPAYQDIYQLPLAINGRMLPDYDTLVYNASLMFVNSHPPLGQTIPVPGNVRLVGGHHIELPLPSLQQELKSVMDKAKAGVILFSLGPDFLGKVLPQDLKRDLVRTFEHLEQTVVWQMEEKLDFTPKNLYLTNSSQISILNHPNTLVLVTVGDIVSMIEATYTGVPVIGIPLHGDQFSNIDLAVERACAIRVDVTRYLVRELKDAINEIVGNYSYRSNAKTSSSIFRRRMPPAHMDLQHWVQLVVSTRGATHLRSPALGLSFFERYNLDILAACAMLLWFLSKVVKVVRVHLREDEHTDRYGKKYQ
ncbi:UDP-glucosyltransferase 2-like isoform X2 [Plodia interpunctella]|uniref:UDP-glucosyltransferase 2-like isoform X2 n=1 Tax=Plodia interpunctella TaxID=58824 RepID=UPI002367FB9E|nr:UDP-glucosyltransferase 2-like isoform X2 [Plodia interpunctella]